MADLMVGDWMDWILDGGFLKSGKKRHLKYALLFQPKCNVDKLAPKPPFHFFRVRVSVCIGGRGVIQYSPR